MAQFHVVEQFVSINGEGRKAGQLALFVRFAGCNLQCDYCDTKWANEAGVPYESYTVEQLVLRIKEAGIRNVTLTGGEPLLQEGMKELLDRLREDKDLRIEIETNGSVDITPYSSQDIEDNVTFTLDYKTAVSGMEDRMCLSNYANMRSCDTVKFVVGSRGDLEQAGRIIKQYDLVSRECGVYLSPCFGKIDPADIVDYIVEHKMNGVNVQLQLHKFIWDPDKRGV